MVRRAEGLIPGLSGTCWSLSPPGWCSVVSVVYGESRRLQCALTQTGQSHSDQFFTLLSSDEKFSKKLFKKNWGKNKTKPKLQAERCLCSKSRGQAKDGGFALVIDLKKLHICLMKKLLFNLISELDLNNVFFKCMRLNRKIQSRKNKDGYCLIIT